MQPQLRQQRSTGSRPFRPRSLRSSALLCQPMLQWSSCRSCCCQHRPLLHRGCSTHRRHSRQPGQLCKRVLQAQMQRSALRLQVLHTQRQWAAWQQYSRRSLHSRLQSEHQQCTIWHQANRSQQQLRGSLASQSSWSMSLSSCLCQQKAWCLQPWLSYSSAPGNAHSSRPPRQHLQFQWQPHTCSLEMQARQKAGRQHPHSQGQHPRLCRSSTRLGLSSRPAVWGWMGC